MTCVARMERSVIRDWLHTGYELQPLRDEITGELG